MTTVVQYLYIVMSIAYTLIVDNVILSYIEVYTGI